MGAVTLEEAEVAVEGGLERDVGVRARGDRGHGGGAAAADRGVPGILEGSRARARGRGLGFWGLGQERWEGFAFL